MPVLAEAIWKLFQPRPAEAARLGNFKIDARPRRRYVPHVIRMLNLWLSLRAALLTSRAAVGF